MSRIENRSGFDVVYLSFKEIVSVLGREGALGFIQSSGAGAVAMNRDVAKAVKNILFEKLITMPTTENFVVVVEETILGMGRHADALIEHELGHCVNDHMTKAFKKGADAYCENGIVADSLIEFEADDHAASTMGKTAVSLMLKRTVLYNVCFQLAIARSAMNPRMAYREMISKTHSVLERIARMA